MTSIDWGDGTTDSNLTHTYTAIGEYTCKIYGVTSIGSDTVGDDGKNGFLNCKPLTKLIIGNSVTKISVWSIGRCDNLESVTIADSVTEIGSLAFGHCFNLTSVNIPYGITKIESQCFYECTSLTSIEIPETVTEIGRAAFGACSSLKTIEVNAKTPPTLGESVFGLGTSPTRMISPIESLEAYKTAEGWSDYATLICSYVYTTDRNEFVKEGITQNTLTMTDEEKTSACGWLGALAKVETTSQYARFYGVDCNGNQILYIMSDGNYAKAGTLPHYYSSSTGYGDTDDSGGVLITGMPKRNAHATPKKYIDNLPDYLTLTDEQKAKWKTWLESILA
jgi:hypothetical protein